MEKFEASRNPSRTAHAAGRQPVMPSSLLASRTSRSLMKRFRSHARSPLDGAGQGSRRVAGACGRSARRRDVTGSLAPPLPGTSVRVLSGGRVVGHGSRRCEQQGQCESGRLLRDCGLCGALSSTRCARAMSMKRTIRFGWLPHDSSSELRRCSLGSRRHRCGGEEHHDGALHRVDVCRARALPPGASATTDPGRGRTRRSRRKSIPAPDSTKPRTEKSARCVPPSFRARNAANESSSIGPALHPTTGRIICFTATT